MQLKTVQQTPAHRTCNAVTDFYSNTNMVLQNKVQHYYQTQAITTNNVD